MVEISCNNSLLFFHIFTILLLIFTIYSVLINCCISEVYIFIIAHNAGFIKWFVRLQFFVSADY